MPCRLTRRSVELLEMVRGRRVEEVIDDVESLAKTYGDAIYLPWPGPNSNTFA